MVCSTGFTALEYFLFSLQPVISTINMLGNPMKCVLTILLGRKELS